MKLKAELEAYQHINDLHVEGENLVHQKNQETRKEMKAVIIQMEEHINEYWAKENSLNEQVESLIAELKVKSEMQEQIAGLKQKLLSSEIQFTEEAFKIIKVASAGKEAALISKLEEHASKLKDKDSLCEQLKQQKELNLAHTTISEQCPCPHDGSPWEKNPPPPFSGRWRVESH
ncbi:hypothetical protein Taro_020368 [Colocasia esculenta]|uniref:Uncharacterized protein n=1 Tax=Colocasia esculenta TaxID=4460 RepID=A0A843V889_COLES|nr:hypothetical protein [Colocasia esculenta]